jgi:acyl phosphate:glycerol-3-phosphate acyltransferase
MAITFRKAMSEEFMESAPILLLLILAYLLGSIPTAYLIGRWVKKIDLRRYGSGTLSGSMVYEHVGRWLVIPVGLFDIAKAALPTWIGLQAGYGQAAAIAAGLAAAIGHDWPIFLGFHGGRGLGAFIGILLVLFPWGIAWLLGFLAVGYALGDSAPWAIASLFSLPLLIWLLRAPPELYLLALGMVVITLAKRLEANRRPLPPPGAERKRVIVRRLIFDRDIANHREWIRRQI